MGRTVQLNTINCILVCIYDAVETIAFWIENVAIKREAVVGSVGVGGYCSAKPKDWNLFVSVVVL